MSYDYHTAGETTTGLNAPLYGGSLSVNYSVSSWLAGGASPSKVTLSVPFYGHSWTLSSESNHDVGAPGTTGIAGPFTQSPGVLGFNEVSQNSNRQFKNLFLKRSVLFTVIGLEFGSMMLKYLMYTKAVIGLVMMMSNPLV